MKKKIFVGLLLGLVLAYLSVRGLRWEAVAAGFRHVRYGWIGPVLALLLLLQVVRIWRWGVLLAPLGRVDALPLFAVSNVGFLAIVALPARLGELARPYLIARRSRIRMTSALGTIVVERVFDSLTILVLAVTLLLFVPLPPWLIRSSVLLCAATMGLLAFMVFLLLRRETALRWIAPAVRLLPRRLSDRIMGLLHQFIDGFESIRDGRRLLQVLGSTLLIWGIDALALYLLLLAFGFSLSLVDAAVVMVVLIIGIAIPTAPGFVGNWHFFCILGLALYGIPRTDALAFAVVYHALSVGIVLLLGLLSLPFNRFSLSDLSRQATDAAP